MKIDDHERAPFKVLAVDDNEENLFSLQALLRASDIDVLLARSAVEALGLMLVHDVALAVLDVQMPLVDGYQLAMRMRGSDRTRRIPILFLTAGATDRTDGFRVEGAATVEFVLKPIDCRTLRHKTRSILQMHGRETDPVHAWR